MNRLILALLLVLVPAQSWAGEPWWYRASQIAAGAGHGSDLATSEYAFGAHKGVETNPALGRFTTNPFAFGVTKAGIGTAGIIAVDHIPNRKLGAIVNFVTAGFFFTIAASNARKGK